MSPIECRNCGRRLRLPEAVSARKTKGRCPRCQTKFDLAPFLPAREPVAANADAPPGPPPAAALSLDDALPLPPPLSLDDDPPPRPAPVARPPVVFRVVVLADSRNQLAGRRPAALSAAGLALGPAGLLLPVGSTAEAAARGGELTVTAGGRTLELRVGGVGHPQRLAADVADVLTGGPFDLDPADYRTPWWVPAAAAGLALALAAGPAALGDGTPLGPAGGLVLGGVLSAVALAVNLLIGRRARVDMGPRVVLMAGASAALLVAFLLAATAFLSATRNRPPAAPAPSPAAPPPAPPESPADPPPDPGLPPPDHPPTFLDVLRQTGTVRLDDGRGVGVAALAAVPGQPELLVCHDDGGCRVWPLDQPTFEVPRLGPLADAAPRRADFVGAGRRVALTTNLGSVVAPLDAPPSPPLKLAGDPTAVRANPDGSLVYASVRAGRVAVRRLPAEWLRKPPGPPTGRAVVPVPKLEVAVAGMKGDYAPPAKPTFLAWHPTGRLLAGLPGGSVVGWSPPAMRTETVSRDHKATVRAWASSPAGDFVTGDDGGVVAFWTAGRSSPGFTLKVFPGPVVKLAVSPHGLWLAAVDAAGAVSVWDTELREEMAAVKHPAPVKAVAFGPDDDVLAVGVGAAVEVWELDTLATER